MSLAAVPTWPAISRADFAVSLLARAMNFVTVSLRSLKSLWRALRSFPPDSIASEVAALTASLPRFIDLATDAPELAGKAAASDDPWLLNWSINCSLRRVVVIPRLRVRQRYCRRQSLAELHIAR